MHKFQLDLKNEIMATDIRIILLDEKVTENEMKADCATAIKSFKEFEKRFSRFRDDSELSLFNFSVGKFTPSKEFASLLKLSKSLFVRTKGLFNIAILPSLVNEGYSLSKTQGFGVTKPNETISALNQYYPRDIKFNKDVVTKPVDLKIDLGGMGKGYIVDQVARYYKRKYKNFLVDAGGDIFLSGKNAEAEYVYWAIDLENPVKPNESIATLMLRNMAVATSGVNRRKWLKDGVEKNHIIEPSTGKSVSNNLLTVTVINKTTMEADVWAKTLLLMGLDDGLAFANAKKIPAYFVLKDLSTYCSDRMNRYVWKA